MEVDYLQSVGRIFRIVACTACAAATAFCLLCLWVFASALLKPDSSGPDLKTAWFCVFFFGLVGLTAGSIGYRVARGVVSTNKVTTMPVWFIRAFGAVWLSGVVIVAYDKHDWLFAAEGASMALAMIFIGRRLAKRRGRTLNQPAA
jgi:hypothetical protein